MEGGAASPEVRRIHSTLHVVAAHYTAQCTGDHSSVGTLCVEWLAWLGAGSEV